MLIAFRCSVKSTLNCTAFIQTENNFYFNMAVKESAILALVALWRHRPEPGSVQLWVVAANAFAVAGGSSLVQVQMASSVGPGRLAPGLLSSVLLLLVLTGLSGPVSAVSQPGKWILDVDSVSFLVTAASCDAGCCFRDLLFLLFSVDWSFDSFYGVERSRD